MKTIREVLLVVCVLIVTAGCSTWHTLYVPSLQPVYLSPPPYLSTDKERIRVDSVDVIETNFKHIVTGGYEVPGKYITFSSDGSELYVSDIPEKLDSLIGADTYLFIAHSNVQVSVSKGINPFTLFFYLLFNAIAGDSEEEGGLDADTEEQFIIRGTVYKIHEKE